MNKKSVWAVVAGVLFIIVVSTLVDIVLHALRVFPPMKEPINDSLAMLAASYRVGVVGTFLGLVGVVATWNQGLGPRWYPVLLAVLAIPQCWVGGKLYEMQAGKRA